MEKISETEIQNLKILWNIISIRLIIVHFSKIVKCYIYKMDSRIFLSLHIHLTNSQQVFIIYYICKIYNSYDKFSNQAILW